jgi:hypothetical protein
MYYKRLFDDMICILSEAFTFDLYTSSTPAIVNNADASIILSMIKNLKV